MSLLHDHSYFAYDHGPTEHGGVEGWWFEDHYAVELGEAAGSYRIVSSGYERDLERGRVAVANDGPIEVSFDPPHRDSAYSALAATFTVQAGGARIYVLDP